MKVIDVSFDLDDKNLFEVDDLKLKADAIKNSILPKLEIINNHTIATISEVYQINPLQFSTVLKFPSFRKNRTTEFKIEYFSSEAGLGGKRDKKLWTNVYTQKHEQPFIVPFSLTYCLDKEGLKFYFLTDRYNINLKDNKMFFDFHLAYESEINALSNTAKTTLLKYFDNNKENPINPFVSLKEYVNWQIGGDFLDLPYFSETIKYPVTSKEIATLIEQFVIFYPLYDNHILLSCGREIRLKEQIPMLTNWLLASVDKEEITTDNVEHKVNLNNIDILKSAETKIRVMPALRWQVFQRDSWRCLSCGRTSDDGIILHIDHIIPRSKGGQDYIDNYQTLCDICNIGKSNKDQTDLRKR